MSPHVMYFTSGSVPQYGIDYILITKSKSIKPLVELIVHLLILTRQHLYSYQ